MNPLMDKYLNKVICGDAMEVLRRMPDRCVQMCVTSPPYWGLRDYGTDGQIGLERTPEEFIARLVDVFREVRRVLRDDGTLWVVIGDSYATGAGKVGECPGGGPQCEKWKAHFGNHTPGSSPGMKGMTQPNRLPLPGLKPKDLVGIPWLLAFALRSDGWYLRQDVIWHKPNPMPEPVRDRCTKAHEYLFLMSKSRNYFYDGDAIKEDGTLQKSGNTQHKYVHGQQLHRTKSGFLEMHNKIYEKVNRRSVWTIPTYPYSGAHYATFPPDLVEPCILAGSRTNDTVLDPFIGTGTTAFVARKHGRHYIGIEINPEYCEMASARIARETAQRTIWQALAEAKTK